ncbi:hypothetical protein LSAT2_015656 [Lamellibrachia satsuma]|nr:hypothetical protein LSAT2_015656 [Lamellibrachia satsuma]
MFASRVVLLLLLPAVIDCCRGGRRATSNKPKQLVPFCHYLMEVKTGPLSDAGADLNILKARFDVIIGKTKWTLFHDNQKNHLLPNMVDTFPIYDVCVTTPPCLELRSFGTEESKTCHRGGSWHVSEVKLKLLAEGDKNWEKTYRRSPRSSHRGAALDDKAISMVQLPAATLDGKATDEPLLTVGHVLWSLSRRCSHRHVAFNAQLESRGTPSHSPVTASSELAAAPSHNSVTASSELAAAPSHNSVTASSELAAAPSHNSVTASSELAAAPSHNSVTASSELAAALSHSPVTVSSELAAALSQCYLWSFHAVLQYTTEAGNTVLKKHIEEGPGNVQYTTEAGNTVLKKHIVKGPCNVQYTTEAGNTVLKKHIEEGPGNVQYTNKTIQNELIQVITDRCHSE